MLTRIRLALDSLIPTGDESDPDPGPVPDDSLNEAAQQIHDMLELVQNGSKVPDDASARDAAKELFAS